MFFELPLDSPCSGPFITWGSRLVIGAVCLASVIGKSLDLRGLVVMVFRRIDVPNCGCYGVFFPQPLRWYSPLEDMILVWHELCFVAVRKKDREAVDTYS